VEAQARLAGSDRELETAGSGRGMQSASIEIQDEYGSKKRDGKETGCGKRK
jgi:hypothetical protein